MIELALAGLGSSLLGGGAADPLGNLTGGASGDGRQATSGNASTGNVSIDSGGFGGFGDFIFAPQASAAVGAKETATGAASTGGGMSPWLIAGAVVAAVLILRR